jgi:conflict system pore-forming effector with SLATT domain
MSRSASPDLTPSGPPAIGWGSGEPAANLERLYEWAQAIAVDAVDWYLTEKRRKARWSRGLRAVAAVLTAVGGAVPVVAISAGRPAWGNWGYVLLALAAGCAAYDRFFGFSAAWLRYMSAATTLRALLDDFRLRWTMELARLGGAEPDRDQVVHFVGLVREFTGAVHGTVRSETDAWLTEFNVRLTELEGQLRTGETRSRGGRGGTPEFSA